ncbi:hypothetical protein A9Q02_08845 [Candidatus Chloroploca asiatica]|uniref:Uncharacterized protein n=1 Tax=Candidatus Chloroploca asiatica TaxID=1506545 RepID=A0A2H3KSQ5_9CHLR|nr:hypothetical protein A9Q02_08845 [Candidatus Chloroploca asiatica]
MKIKHYIGHTVVLTSVGFRLRRLKSALPDVILKIHKPILLKHKSFRIAIQQGCGVAQNLFRRWLLESTV